MATNSEDWFTDYTAPIRKDSKVALEKWLMESKIKGCEPR